MKKLLVAGLLAVSCSAFAGLPAGYEDAPEASGNGARTIVNKEKGAVITVALVQDKSLTSAKAAAESVASELKCEVNVQGNDDQAGFENCTVNNQKMSVAVVRKDDKFVVVSGNDKVTEEDIATIFAD